MVFIAMIIELYVFVFYVSTLGNGAALAVVVRNDSEDLLEKVGCEWVHGGSGSSSRVRRNGSVGDNTPHRLLSYQQLPPSSSPSYLAIAVALGRWVPRAVIS